jgi:4'-phosphopantetheinyl transferase
MTVDVAWHDVEVGADAALAAHVGARLGAGTVLSGRLCGRCGSAGHGRPWARHEGSAVSVSLARSGPHLVTAMAQVGEIGVDVESVSEVAGRWQPELVLAPGEAADEALEQAWVWAGKEAVLKAYGVGLDRPMTTVDLGDLTDASWERVEAPEGYVAAVAVLTPRPAVAAAPPGTATRRTGPSGRGRTRSRRSR